MVNPKTRERLRLADMIDRPLVYLTYKANHAELRKVMAGEPVLRPIDLFIYLGGDPETFGEQDSRQCVAILRRFGYQDDRFCVRLLAAPENVDRVFIRTDHWPEDAHWDEQARLAKEQLMAKIGLLDLLEEAKAHSLN